MNKYDVTIAGAGVSGLLAAINIAKAGLKVLLLEEKGIGLKPCGGLTTLNSLKTLGIPPRYEFIIKKIKRGNVHIQNKSFGFNLDMLNLIVIDRSSLDTYLAERAILEGADLAVKESLLSIKNGGTVLKTDKRTIETKFLIDARGGRVYNLEKLPAYQFLVVGKKFLSDEIHIWINKEKVPRFFTWYIPINSYKGKLGSAGLGAEHFLLDLCEKEEFSILKIEKAPIILGGPKKPLVDGHKLIIGDAAGQAKPTTGGGIFTGGMGGILAAKWAVRAIEEGKPSLVKRYEKEWFSKIGRELIMQKMIRRLFLKFSEQQIERVIRTVENIPGLNEELFNKHTLFLEILIKSPKLISMFTPEIKSAILNLYHRFYIHRREG